ncbi:MAG: Tim44/TimA family putative adaptor protein [Rhizobiaceae bacterium]
MQYLDFSTLIFFVAAVIVFLQLRGVLGKRTGSERPPFDPFAGSRRVGADKSQDESNVITLPKRKADGTKDYTVVDAVAPAGSDVNKGLRLIKDADPAFDPAEFFNGAKMAYEMIVTAFADGDRKALKGLLSKEVYDGFVAAINDREMRGEKIESSFVGISKADFADAEMKGSEANITLKLVSQLITATIDKDGKVVDGDREAVTEVKDVWTFARDTRSRDPNWKLVATEAEE